MQNIEILTYSIINECLGDEKFLSAIKIENLINKNISTINIVNTPGTLTNVPTRSSGFTLILRCTVARTVNWGSANIKWANNISPTLSSGSIQRDVYSFITFDNGTSWLGFVGGQGYPSS